MRLGEVGWPTTLGGYEIDILVQGYPGKSVHNGGLGWSTVTLLRGHGRVILLDTGGFGLRAALKQRLGALGLACDDVTDVLLSHSHWDHIVNYPLFPRARLHIGQQDLEWAISGDESVYAVAEFYAQQLAREPRLTYLEIGKEAFPSIRTEHAPGHTPGHLLFVLVGEDRDLIFAQDAAKSRAELVSLTTDLTIDHAQSRATLENIWTLWKARDGTIVVPGHDLPLILEGGAVKTLGERQAAIVGFLGDSLEEQTHFSLSVR
ncbi:MBL fold metallo-hydrolase [Aminobacter sp. AP02]|uniref:MBL fold metallo-hydrolase n=1 Tax=Aminobacter sp. AP02 TaxID=2135737 RepID=UPI000D6C23B4|nr:MBL fold metallo-hydrolase [Aminobacter sp. AP02]PWK61280.1 glyoxylase-like metal-dependent hydrolase (beta-lactamase superfamily II) [Aminobacter sp. AP02]